MMFRSFTRFLPATILLFPVGLVAGTISTAEILSNTTSAAVTCMQWRPIGICFWLRCTIYSCDVETSIKVGHYNPDLVVGVYNELGANPWTEMKSILNGIQSSAANGMMSAMVPVESAGNRTEGSPDGEDHKNLIFRETDAIGHPLSSLSGVVSGTGYLCESQTTAFLPYFQSALDAFVWRWGIPEMFYPASLVPGMREIGDWPLQTWGGVYPRTGWTIQAEEPKAAAINAQRAGDIVTRTGQTHLYIPITDSGSSGQKVWPPGPLKEKDRRTGTWQMLLPIAESSCGVFGENDLATTEGWGGGKVDAEGDYIWNLWRPYKCCERKGQVFLYSIDWMPYPP